MHWILRHAFINLFLFMKPAKNLIFRKVLIFCCDLWCHGLKYYGELLSQGGLGDGADAGRKEAEQSSARTGGQRESLEKQELGKIVFRNQKRWEQGWDVFVWGYSRLVYVFPMLLFCSALKSKCMQLFQEMQPAVDLELRRQDRAWNVFWSTILGFSQ